MNDLVKKKIVSLCRKPCSFEYISHKMHGCDLAVLHNLLKELEESKDLSFDGNYWVDKGVNAKDAILQESSHYLENYMGIYSFLSKPHPLDYEWRNSTKTLNHFVENIMEEAGDVLLLGMPTLYSRLLSSPFSGEVTLIDKNHTLDTLSKQVKEGYTILQEDIYQFEPKRNYDLVFMDPPWYELDFKSFLWVSSNSIGLGGLVYVCMPSKFTRENVFKERDVLFEYAKKLGLSLISLYPDTIEYSMPFFEFNAYRSAGISDLSPFWRKGDLIIFQKLSNLHIERPKHQLETDWEEYIKDGVRFKFRKLNDDLEDIKSIVQGDILSSVSRNDKRRSKVNLWTSGNRVFQVSYDTFVNLTKNLETKLTPVIEHITNLENKEYEKYLEWIYYELERTNY